MLPFIKKKIVFIFVEVAKSRLLKEKKTSVLTQHRGGCQPSLVGGGHAEVTCCGWQHEGHNRDADGRVSVDQSSDGQEAEVEATEA